MGEELQELEGRALQVADRRREALQRMAETRRKMRELGQRISEQEVLLHECPAGNLRHPPLESGAMRMELASVPATREVQVVRTAEPPASGVRAPRLRRAPLPQLRGSYCSRSALHAADSTAELATVPAAA